MSIEGGRSTIGVQQPSSDPHIESFDGLDLAGLAQEVPVVIGRARARWEDEDMYPAHERPAPPSRRRTQRDQALAQSPTATGQATRSHRSRKVLTHAECPSLGRPTGGPVELKIVAPRCGSD